MRKVDEENIEEDVDGLRHQGRSKRQWMDDIEEWSGCNYIQLKEMSQDREQWRRKTIEWSSAVANRHRPCRWSTSEWVSEWRYPTTQTLQYLLCTHVSYCSQIWALIPAVSFCCQSTILSAIVNVVDCSDLGSLTSCSFHIFICLCSCTPETCWIFCGAVKLGKNTVHNEAPYPICW